MTVRIFPLIVNVVSDIIGSLRILSYIYVTLGYEIKCNYDIFASQKLWVFQETSFRYDYKVFFCWNTFFFFQFSLSFFVALRILDLVRTQNFPINVRVFIRKRKGEKSYSLIWTRTCAYQREGRWVILVLRKILRTYQIG